MGLNPAARGSSAMFLGLRVTAAALQVLKSKSRFKELSGFDSASLKCIPSSLSRAFFISFTHVQVSTSAVLESVRTCNLFMIKSDL